MLEEIEQNELKSKKHKEVCTALNYVQKFLIVVFIITGCISIFGFACLLGIPVGITSFATGLTIYAIASGMKKYNLIIKKIKNKLDRIALLANSKLNSIEVLVFKTLTDSNNSHDEFVLITNVIKECDDIKDKVRNLKT